MAKKPGIAKKHRPQRDSQGRFAAKPLVYETLYYETDTSQVLGVQLGQKAQSQGPNALKRFRNWLGFRLIALGGNILSL